nr:oligoribonuclease [Mycobacterium kiyosense]
MRDEMVWIDCEMTGLDLGSDKLIEIAALVTDADLNILGEGIDVVIHAEDAALSSMIDVVKEMHARSGLTDEVRASAVDVPTAEAMVLDYIHEHVKQPKTAPLAGNSIATDRSFIARDMPTLDSFLHYRMIDVSSIKELCRRWYPRIYFGQPPKGLAHRALADIHEHVKQPKTAPLAGNSIATDRSFIARDMPTLDSFLHYRMIDVSSIKELCRRWYPRIYFGQPPKGLAHRALADIHESIRELQYYRRTAFVPQPGPSTSEIAMAVANLAGAGDAPERNDSAQERPSG